MEDKDASHSLPRGLQELGPFTAAITLWALPLEPYDTPLRAYLTRQVRSQLTPAWVAQGPIEVVFAALVALATQKPSALDGTLTAHAVQRLVAAESTVGGPYTSGGAVTPGINALVSCFAKTAAQPLPKVNAYLLRLGAHPHDPLVSPDVLTYILRRAGCATTLQPVQSVPFIQGEPVSAFASRVLADSAHELARTSSEDYLHEAIIQQVRELFAGYGPHIAEPAHTLITTIQRADTSHEIALMPHIFAQSLRTPTRLSPADVRELCVANVCGWLAYTVYDQFLDSRGTREFLPVALIASRLSVQLFQKAAPHPDLVSRLFDTMDLANAWELDRARMPARGRSVTVTVLPKYKKGAQLAERSVAHTLGPLIVLAHAGTKAGELHTAEAALRNFLIAKQLADDLCDWQADIRAGHMSYVVTAILRDMRLPPGLQPLESLLPAMHAMFAERTRARMCEHIMQHTSRARSLLADALHAHSPFFNLVDTLEHVARKTLAAEQQSRDFLQALQVRGMGAPRSSRGAR